MKETEAHLRVRLPNGLNKAVRMAALEGNRSLPSQVARSLAADPDVARYIEPEKSKPTKPKASRS